PLDDPRVRLRDDADRAEQHGEHEDRDHHEQGDHEELPDEWSEVHQDSFGSVPAGADGWAGTTSAVAPSIRMTTTRSPSSSATGPAAGATREVHVSPLSSLT